MIEVLLVSNGNKDDVENIKERIYNLGEDFFIESNVIAVDSMEAENINFDYDFAVTLDNKVVLDKKTIDATPILLDRAGEKTEKDIQNQLLKARATHKRQKESRER
ncbi:hypothetical protein [Anaerofustis stercorihominis]|uniref:hypothetical protein n=1 Tax=Anaerofustis stercorihominis TaxID=214853 RepID=UPI00214C42F0|nr:hypothetical protein [Anaerofustis stercorihominis]MCR2032687.1 hypothetical protein [Anaerofustis stercorihominis]